MLVGELYGNLKLDTKEWISGLAQAKAEFSSFGKGVSDDKSSDKLKQSFTKDIRDIRGAFGGLGGDIGNFLKSSVLSVTNLPLFTAIAAGIGSTVGALGVVPAVGGAAALTYGALAIGVSGFGDALKTANTPAQLKAQQEALAALSPEARGAAVAIQGLHPQITSLKNSVQDSLFKGFGEDIKLTAGSYLPLMQRELTSTAGGFNAAGHEVTGFLRERSTINDMGTSLGNMSSFNKSLASSFKPVVAILIDLVTVGSSFLPGMGIALHDGAVQAEYFVNKARETGKLKEWIQGGIDSVKLLVTLLVNAGGILAGVFKSSNTDGQGMLKTLVALSQAALQWVNSAQGQEKLGEIWKMLNSVSTSMLTIIPMVARAVAVLASWFNMLPEPMQHIIGMTIGWSGAAILVAGKLAPVIGLIGKFGPEVLKALPSIAQFIAASITMGIRILTVTTQMVLNIVWSVSVWIGRMTLAAAETIAKWTLMAVQGLIQAGRMAAAWIIAMGPVAWVIATVVALVALIILNWDTVKRVTTAVWNAIWGFIQSVWGWIRNYIAGAVANVLDIIGWFARLPGMVSDWFWRAVHGAGDAVGFLISLVLGIPGRVLGALGNLGGLLFNAGRNIIQGLIDGVMNMVGAVGNAIGTIAGKIRGFLPFSPAKEGPLSGSGSPDIAGRKIGSMLADGMMTELNNIRNVSLALTGNVKLSSAEQSLIDSAHRVLVGNSSGGNAPAVNIENFHPAAATDEKKLAGELDWLAKGRGM